jgi:hypothetical protein
MRRMKKGVFLGTVDEIGNEGDLHLKRRVVRIKSTKSDSTIELYFDLKITNRSLNGINEIVLDGQEIRRSNRSIYDISIGGTKYQLIRVLKGMHEKQTFIDNGNEKIVSLAEIWIRNYFDNIYLLEGKRLELLTFFTSLYAFGRICDIPNKTNIESMIVSCSTYESVDVGGFNDEVYNDMISILKSVHIFYKEEIHFYVCCLANTLKSNGKLFWDITKIRLRTIPKAQSFAIALSKVIDISNLLFNNRYFLNGIKVQFLGDVDFGFISKKLKTLAGCVAIPHYAIFGYIDSIKSDELSYEVLKEVLKEDRLVDQYIEDVQELQWEFIYKTLYDKENFSIVMRSIISEYNGMMKTTGKSNGPKPLVFLNRQLYIKLSEVGPLDFLPLFLEAEGRTFKLYTQNKGVNTACDRLSIPTSLCDGDQNVFISNKTQAMFYFSIQDNQLIASSFRQGSPVHKIIVKIAVQGAVLDSDVVEMTDVSFKKYDIAHTEEILYGGGGDYPLLYDTMTTVQHQSSQNVPIITNIPHNLIYPNDPNMHMVQPPPYPVHMVQHPPVPMPVPGQQQVVFPMHVVQQPQVLMPSQQQVVYQDIRGVPMVPPQPFLMPNPLQVVRNTGIQPYIQPQMARQQNITINPKYTKPLTLFVGRLQYHIVSPDRHGYCYSNVSGSYKLYKNINESCFELPDTEQVMFYLNGSVVRPFVTTQGEPLYVKIFNGLYLQIGVRNPAFTVTRMLDLSKFPLILE